MTIGTEIWCVVSLSYPRSFVSRPSRQAIFNSLHDLSHSGIKGSVRLMKSRFFWPNMERDIRKFARECTTCQKSKITRHTQTEIQQFNLQSNRFETVHIDLVGPVPPVKQQRVFFKGNDINEECLQ